MKRLKVPLFLILSSLFLSNSAFAEDVLTWRDCMAEAARNHPNLIEAVEAISESKSTEKVTASSLYPQVTGNLDASTAKTAATKAKSSSTSDTYSYGVSGTQLVFDGFKTANKLKASRENTNVAKESYRFTSSEVRLRLRAAFINLLKAQKLLLVARDITKIRKDNLVLIALRYQSGLEHRGALLTAQANLAQAKFEMDQARRDLEVAQRQLNKEMGRVHFVPMQVKGEFHVSETAKEKPNFETIVKNNPSLLKQVAVKNAAAFDVKAAKASFLPVLTGEAGAGMVSSHWPPGGDQWNLGLGLSLPLFEGGLRVAQVSAAKAVLKQAQAKERSTRDSAILTLEQMWASLQDAIDTVGVQAKFLSASEERAKIAEAQYSIGTISYDNWTIIQDDLVNTKKFHLNAGANALLAEANWIQAKGETLEYAN